jgi:hypothetical protein
MSAKQAVLRAVHAMPADSTMKQIADRIAALSKPDRAGRAGTDDAPPESETARVRRNRRVVKEMLAWRDRYGPKLGELTIRRIIEEGRRY